MKKNNKKKFSPKQIITGCVLVLLLLFLAACQPSGGSKPSEKTSGTNPPAETSEEKQSEAAPGGDVKKTEKSQEQEQRRTLKVGASPTPHALILKAAEPLLAAKGLALEIVEFDDYVLPNLALQSGELDANYFQHLPYLEDFNKNNDTELFSIGTVHYEPFGIYAGKSKSLADVKKGAEIAVPNDGSNEARALLLLQDAGLIKLRDGAGLDATVIDISENPQELKITELAAAQLPRSLADVDFAVINGNYALQAGLRADKDALKTEAPDSKAATLYANIICVRKDHLKDEDLQILIDVLQGSEIENFIRSEFKGAVEPVALKP